jgi:hypothetical protein
MIFQRILKSTSFYKTITCVGTILISAVFFSHCSGTRSILVIDFPTLADTSEPFEISCCAYYIASAECGPCPPDALCEPCFNATIISSQPNEGGAELWVEGTRRGLKPGRAYIFTLRISSGFREQLNSRDNNPVRFHGPPPIRLLSVKGPVEKVTRGLDD